MSHLLLPLFRTVSLGIFRPFVLSSLVRSAYILRSQRPNPRRSNPNTIQLLSSTICMFYNFSRCMMSFFPIHHFVYFMLVTYSCIFVDFYCEVFIDFEISFLIYFARIIYNYNNIIINVQYYCAVLLVWP